MKKLLIPIKCFLLVVYLLADAQIVSSLLAKPYSYIVRHKEIDNREMILHIWVKSFIPKDHPKNSGYIKPVPGRSNQYMIGAPHDFYNLPIPFAEKGVCYLTDNRTFSNDPKASARATTEFVIKIDGSGKVVIEKVDGREIFRCSKSEKLDCTTGESIQKGQATIKIPVTGEVPTIGGPHVADNLVQVIFSASAQDPIVPVWMSAFVPTLDYSCDFIYNIDTQELEYKATIGTFPSFEAYASINGNVPVIILREEVTGEEVESLLDAGGVANTKQLNGKVKLK